MIRKGILAVVVAVVTGLVLVGLIGPILASLNVHILALIGGFLIAYGRVLAILAGIWFFFAGPTTWPPFNRLS